MENRMEWIRFDKPIRLNQNENEYWTNLNSTEIEIGKWEELKREIENRME